MNDRVYLPEGNGQLVEVYLSQEDGKNLMINVKRFEEDSVRIYRSPVGKVSKPTNPIFNMPVCGKIA